MTCCVKRCMRPAKAHGFCPIHIPDHLRTEGPAKSDGAELTNRIAIALEQMASQSEQQSALLASLAESLRIVVDAIERASEEEG